MYWKNYCSVVNAVLADDFHPEPQVFYVLVWLNEDNSSTEIIRYLSNFKHIIIILIGSQEEIRELPNSIILYQMTNTKNIDRIYAFFQRKVEQKKQQQSTSNRTAKEAGQEKPLIRATTPQIR